MIIINRGQFSEGTIKLAVYYDDQKEKQKAQEVFENEAGCSFIQPNEGDVLKGKVTYHLDENKNSGCNRGKGGCLRCGTTAAFYLLEK